MTDLNILNMLDRLVEYAKEAMKSAYAPYSHFYVGAALMTSSGEIYKGCNIENASYTPTVCAERTAFFKAISDGKKEFAAIAVAGGKDGVLSSPAAPCGVCRQVMAEFCRPDFIICIADENGYKKYTLGELLPLSFTPDNLK